MRLPRQPPPHRSIQPRAGSSPLGAPCGPRRRAPFYARECQPGATARASASPARGRARVPRASTARRVSRTGGKSGSKVR
eukprot:scaffold86927_cov60-Phaeocystis_antarctica.AAC.1